MKPRPFLRAVRSGRQVRTIFGVMSPLFTATRARVGARHTADTRVAVRRALFAGRATNPVPEGLEAFLFAAEYAP